MLKNKPLFCILIAFLSLLLTFLIDRSQIIDQYNDQTLDYLIKNQPRENLKGHEDVVMLMVDEASLSALSSSLGRWPWDRRLWSEVIEFLDSFGARSIVFDILFTELQSPRDAEQQLSESDLSLVMASQFSAKVVHAGQFYQDTQDEYNLELLNRPLPEYFETHYSDNLIPFTRDANNYSLPFEELVQASAAIGAVDIRSDRDGVYRRIPLFYHYQDQVIPGLAIAALDVGNKLNVKGKQHNLHVAEQRLPLRENTEYLINIKNDFDVYSMSGLLATMQAFNQGRYDQLIIDPSEFENKIVIIGLSAAGLGDIKATSIDPTLPGPYLHASVISNILDGAIIKIYGGPLGLISLIVLSLLTSSFILFGRNILIQFAPFFLSVITWFFISTHLFNHYTIWLSFFYPTICLILVAGLSFIYLSFTEGREKRKTRKMLAQYVSPHVLKEVMDKQDSLTAEVGQEEVLTVLFSDVRGFTAFSEAAPAAQVVEMLNHYLDSMVDIVFESQGTLDKFIGDALMAFFGAPLRTKEHALHAVQASLEMSKKLIEINQFFDSKGFPPFEIGIGIHTGEVILGNIGSSRKLDYTVIGDNVNLSSRMEGLTKPYGCQILITEETFNRLHNQVPCRPIDKVRVKGKTKPIAIYQPLQGHYAQEITEHYLQAFELYLQQKWDQAISHFENGKKLFENNEDLYTDMMINRCRDFIENPPGEDWDGVYTMTTK